MEKSCENLEDYIAFNQGVVDGQTQQIVRNPQRDLHALTPGQKRLRRRLNTSWGSPRGASGGRGEESHRYLVPRKAFAATAISIVLVFFIARLIETSN